MQLERSDAVLDLSDPNIVLGPRKRRPTERVLENGDPLACKRVRKAYASSVSNAGVDKEDHTSSLIPPPTHPTSATCTTPAPRQAANHADSNDDSTSNGPQAIMVEESDDDGDEGSNEGEATDEDDDAELGACSVNLIYFW